MVRLLHMPCLKCCLSCLKVKISSNNMHVMDNSCYSLLLFLKQNNSDFSVNKCKDAIDQFDSLTNRLTLSVNDWRVTTDYLWHFGHFKQNSALQTGHVNHFACNFANVYRFYKLFHQQRERQFCSKARLPYLKCVATLPCDLLLSLHIYRVGQKK